MLAAGATNG